MKPKKMILVTWAIPFATVLIAVLLFCIVLVSPILGIVVSLHNWRENRVRKDKIRKRYDLELKKRFGYGFDGKL